MESPVSNNTTDPPLSQIICCKLCFSVYKSPKLLPCLHSFCSSCLSNHCDKKASQGRPTVCPSCSESFDVPPQGVANLPNNIVLERAILSNVNQIKISSPTYCRDRSANRSNILPHDDEINEVRSNTYPLQHAEDNVTVEDSLGKGSFSEHATHYQSEQIDEIDFLIHDNDYNKHDKSFPGSQSSEGIVSLQDEDITHMTSQSNVPSPSKDTDTSVFQQEHRMMVKSCSEFSNFSIGSLKFEPPQDYADIEEGDYIESRVFNALHERHDPLIEEQIQRDRIKDELASYQTEALGIVYSIDNLNTEKDRWNQQKQNLQDRIQNRSVHLQDLIKSLERRLLLQVEAHWQDINMMEVIEKHKSYMHNRLKGILAMTDLARMLLDHGQRDELPVFEEMINTRKEKINGQKLSFEKPCMKFVVPTEEDIIVENLFGTLNVVKKSESFWEFCPVSKTQPSVQSVTENDPISHKNSLEPLTNMILSPTDMRSLRNTNKGRCVGSSIVCRSPSIEKLKSDRFSSRRSRSSSARRSFSKQGSPFFQRSKRQSIESANSEDANSLTRWPSKPVEQTRDPSYLWKQTSNCSSKIEVPIVSPPTTPSNKLETNECIRNRRHTEGHSPVDWENDCNFPQTTEASENQHCDNELDNSSNNECGRLRHFSDDVQQTRRMLAMCKKQLLEAQTESRSFLHFTAPDIRGGSLPSSPRERFDHMKHSARHKSFRWRSESRESISSLEDD